MHTKIKNQNSISIDTRTIKKDEIFIAIKGERFDGHDFVKEAFRKGAKSAIVSKGVKFPPKYEERLIRVKDTVEALGEIAKAHRLKFNIPIIAITGSNGKTTSKDMAAFVLSAKYNVLKNETSKNNLIGLPLTLLKLEGKHQIVVLEMGMNHFGEIARLCDIAKPNIGVITNIGPSHLEFLGTLKNVFLAKSELLKSLPRDGIAILNRDDIFLRNAKGLKCKKLYFGIRERCAFQAKNLENKRDKWHFSIGKQENFELPLFGKHNVYNALIAVALARQFGLKSSVIRKKLSLYKKAPSMRLELKNIRGFKILDDSYNSNPFSMECAIDTLRLCNTKGKRIVVSGDMMELGKGAKAMHGNIGRMISKSHVDILVTLGSLSKFMSKGARTGGMRHLYHAKSHNDAAKFLKDVAEPGDIILVKGSRAMQMERVIEELRLQ